MRLPFRLTVADITSATRTGWLAVMCLEKPTPLATGRYLVSHAAFQPQPLERQRPTTARYLCQTPKDDRLGTDEESLEMNHLYQEWTLEQDEQLWKAYQDDQKSIVELAVLLGRGLGGVQARLAKLQDVESPAYQRLFVENSPHAAVRCKKTNDSDNDEPITKKKLVPVSEVLRRLQWDYSLNEDDFTILHYDRVDETVVESPVSAPNDSIASKATRLVEALPEHRILSVKYRQRVVWDKAQRLDLVFGSGENTQGAVRSIEDVIQTYDTWYQQRQEEMALMQQRQAQITNHVRHILGLDRYRELETLLDNLHKQAASATTRSRSGEDSLEFLPVPKSDIETLVEQARALFLQARETADADRLDPTRVPMTDEQALDVFSEWVVQVRPLSEVLKNAVLQEIQSVLHPSKAPTQKQLSRQNRPLPTLLEKDLVETFVRGSGPGGQKINKTNNCVDLIHTPTQLRVSCQETRSLSQNRKLARKWMQQKLDDYLHGRQSKTQLTAQRAAASKARTKSRNRARHKRKKQQQEQDTQQQQ